jgi:hypothetical protein
VTLEQVAAMGCKWKVVPINEWNPQQYGKDIQPKQTLYMYFKFTRIPFELPHKDLPETQISRVIEKLVSSDAYPTLSAGSIPITYSSLSTVSEGLFLIFREPRLIHALMSPFENCLIDHVLNGEHIIYRINMVGFKQRE